MDIQIDRTRKGIIKAVAATVTASVAGYVMSGLLPLSIIWIILLLFLSIPSWTVREENRYLPDLITGLFLSIFVLYFSQFINMAGHEIFKDYSSLFSYMNRRAGGYLIDPRFPTEMLLIVSVYAFLRACRLPRRISSAVTPLLFFIPALADYYVYTFRGSELIFPDLYGASTAFTVAEGYHFPVLIPLGGMICPYILFLIFTFSVRDSAPHVKADAKSILTRAGAFISLFAMFLISFLNYRSFRYPYSYYDQPSQGNGFTLNFLMSMTGFNIQKPEGYDSKRYYQLVSDSYEYSFDPKDSPDIVVIMNESFSDLSVYEGISSSLSEDPIPYFHSLSSADNAVTGFAYSSVFGGRTPNSEYEFLTGITTYALPDGLIPFSYSINSDTFSVASYLRNNGYETYGIHPFMASNWKRDKVYPLLGFKNSIFIDDIDYDQDDLIRSYISDRKAYSIVEDILSEDTSAPRFIFLVTMQNHGGYDMDPSSPLYTEYVDPGTENAGEINTFLSLMNQSDIALEEFLGELSSRDRETIVVLFGDHQPNLGFNSSFTEFGGLSRKVPFMIWSNRDTDGLSSLSSAPETSINYLGIDTLTAAGIPLPPYFEFISGIRKTVPCINSAGYGQGDLDDVINDYLGLQYYVLKDS